MQRPSLPRTKCSDSYYYSDAQFETMSRRKVSNNVTTQSRCDASRVTTQDYHSTTTRKTKLNRATFTVKDKPMRDLTWCNKVPKGKRIKPAKRNGVKFTEVDSRHSVHSLTSV